MSFTSNHEVTDTANHDQAQTLPIPPETVNTQQNNKNTLLGKTTRINGDVSAKGEDLHLNGKVYGTIELRSNHIQIGATGFVEGNIFAKKVICSGEVIGDIYAHDEVELTETARVTGNIFAPNIPIRAGAYFKGNLDMKNQDIICQELTGAQKDEQRKRSLFAIIFGRNRNHEKNNQQLLLPDLRAAQIEDAQVIEETTMEDINFGLDLSDVNQSYIGPNMRIKGEFLSEENVVVQGNINGVIYFRDCSLSIGTRAQIHGDMYIKQSVINYGKIFGKIYCGDQVTIKKPGAIDGQVFAPRVCTEGAVVMGGIEMSAQDVDAIYANLYGPETPAAPQQGEAATVAQQAADQPHTQAQAANAQEAPQVNVQVKNPAWPIFYPRN